MGAEREWEKCGLNPGRGLRQGYGGANKIQDEDENDYDSQTDK